MYIERRDKPTLRKHLTQIIILNNLLLTMNFTDQTNYYNKTIDYCCDILIIKQFFLI